MWALHCPLPSTSGNDGQFSDLDHLTLNLHPFRYPYIATIINFSQMWALYCLLQFYLQSKEWLAHISPVGKFACIKAVIFVTWWQGLAIALLFNLEMTPSEVNVPLQNAIQAFLICIEVRDVKFVLITVQRRQALLTCI